MPTPDESFMDRLPSNYLAVVANVGLVLVSAIECILAAVSSYKSARALCPCFRRAEENGFYDYPIDHHRDALVNSWLGRHSPTQPFYVITAPPSTLGRGSKVRREFFYVYTKNVGLCRSKRVNKAQQLFSSVLRT